MRTKNAHYRIADIKRRHFNQLAQHIGFGKDMERLIDDVVARTSSVIDEVAARLPKQFPAQLFETITKGLRNAATQLERMPAG